MKTPLKERQRNQRYRRTARGVLTNAYNKMKERRGPLPFSLNSFHEWANNQKRFLRLYKEWVGSNYLKELRPVVDRIDCKKGYEFYNMKFLTCAENRYKQRMELKRLKAKTVFQFSNGNLIGVYRSQRDAIKATGVHQGNMSYALNGKRLFAEGYQWSY